MNDLFDNFGKIEKNDPEFYLNSERILRPL